MTGTYSRAVRRRILHVTHELSLTGVPRVGLGVLKALADSYEVRTVSSNGGQLEEEFRALGPVYILNQLPGAADRWDHPAREALSKSVGWARGTMHAPIARLWDPDIVLVNSTAALTLVPRMRLQRRRTVLYAHELGLALDRLTPAHRRLISTVPDRILAVSNAVAEELVHRRNIDGNRIAVVPPIISVAELDERAGVETIRPRRARFLVGGAGNPHWTKGVETWLFTARELVDRLGPEYVEFEWIGLRENTSSAQFRAMVRKLDLTESVTLTPATLNPYPAFRNFDVFAMTSWEESASLVVLENMALGTPVTCFRASRGPAEQLGGTGVVVERFSPTAMADAIGALLRDADRRRDIGVRERHRVARINAGENVTGKLLREFALCHPAASR